MAVDFNQHELLTLLKQFENGRVVLFAGAGYSTGAKNSHGESPPTSRQLGEILCQRCGWDYKGDELPIIYEQAQNHLGTRSLHDLLSGLYQDCTPAPWQLLVPSYCWARIYTTNIDDVIEESWGKGPVQQRLRTVVPPAPYQDQDFWYESTQCVHLHGFVRDPSKPLTFTFEDFAYQTAEPNVWYQALADDMINFSFLFVGTRLAEPPFHHYLSMKDQRSRGVKEFRAGAILVAPDIGRVRARQLRDQNIFPVEATAEDFFSSLRNALGELPKRIEILKRRYPHQISGLQQGQAEIQTELLRQFEFVSVSDFSPVPARTRSLFYLGAEPTWSDIAADMEAQRSFVQDTLERLDTPVVDCVASCSKDTPGAGRAQR